MNHEVRLRHRNAVSSNHEIACVRQDGVSVTQCLVTGTVRKGQNGSARGNFECNRMVVQDIG